MQASSSSHANGRAEVFRLPEMFSKVVRELRARDMGRMLQVSQDFNHILSTNPTLWRIVDLKGDWRVKSPFTIVKVFAARSRNTLEVVQVRSVEGPGDEEKAKELYALLGESRASLRKLVFIPHNDSIFKTISAFPKLEYLNLAIKSFPRVVEDQLSEGSLGLLGIETLPGLGSWSSVELSRFSSLKALSVDKHRSGDTSLRTMLQVCKSSLIYFSLWYFDSSEGLLDDDFPNLEILSLHIYGDISSLTSNQFPKLNSLRGGAKLLSGCPHLKNVENIHFIMTDVWDPFGEGDQSDPETIDGMMKLCSWSSSTLKKIKFETWVCDDPSSIDDFLIALQVTSFKIFCPSISEIYVGPELVHKHSMLAEMMISRNFAANEGLVEGKEIECSRITLFFYSETDLAKFEEEEEKILISCSESFQEKAGRSEVRKWGF